MAYDVELADRLRDVLAAEPDVEEKRMFGGLAFLVAGHMTVAASGNKGGLLLRADPGQMAELLTEPVARPFEMRGKAMKGWLYVDIDASATDEELARWVGVGLDYVRSLPPK